jgi:hypothetical protein
MGIGYHYFSNWRDVELFDEINMQLRKRERKKIGKNAQCSVVIIDSQSVKIIRKGDSETWMA